MPSVTNKLCQFIAIATISSTKVLFEAGIICCSLTRVRVESSVDIAR